MSKKRKGDPLDELRKCVPETSIVLDDTTSSDESDSADPVIPSTSDFEQFPKTTYVLDESSDSRESQQDLPQSQVFGGKENPDLCLEGTGAQSSFVLDESSNTSEDLDITEENRGSKVNEADSEGIEPRFQIKPRVRMFSPTKSYSPSDFVNSKEEMVSCSRNCKYNCSKVIGEKWDVVTQRKVSTMFSKESLLKSKEALLNHLKHQERFGKNTSDIYIFGTYLCAGAFCSLSKLSRHVVLKVLEDYSAGVENYVHGNFGIRKISFATEKFKSWMKSYIEVYSQSDPDKQVQVLSYWLTKTKVLVAMKRFKCMLSRKLHGSKKYPSLERL